MLSEEQLCGLLEKLEFKILSRETIRDRSRSSHIPVQYIKATKG
jgi:hypothetical protein